MGPRLFRRGNAGDVSKDTDVTAASMGPRLFRRGNSGPGSPSPSSRGASMGPRLFRRGNSNFIPALLNTCPCFNGATPFQAWKPPHLATVVVRQPASMGPRLFRRGNYRRKNQSQALPLASMGPRLFRRGNPPPAGASPAPPSSFNGATPFQAWKLYGIMVWRGSSALSFNGATPFQAWKQHLPESSIGGRLPTWFREAVRRHSNVAPRNVMDRYCMPFLLRIRAVPGFLQRPCRSQENEESSTIVSCQRSVTQQPVPALSACKGDRPIEFPAPCLHLQAPEEKRGPDLRHASRDPRVSR